MEISVKECIGKGYNAGWWLNCPARYRVFEGGRSTKKSVNIAGYEPIFKLICDKRRNIIMCRKDDTNNSTSTFPNICNLIIKMGLVDYFQMRNNPQEIIYKPTGQKIIFKGCNNPTAITSTKFAYGELTDIYFEEASELDSYEDFRQIDGSVRSATGGVQITLLMNGWDRESWIYEVFFKDRLEDDYNYLETHDYADYYDPDFSLGQDSKGLYLHKSTFRINEFRSPYKDEAMEQLKEKAFGIYCCEGLGMWGNNTEATYLYWDKKSMVIPHYIMLTEPLSCYTIGIDIGMGNGEGRVTKDPNKYRSAMTMELVGISQDYKKIKCIDEYFFTNENRVVKKGSPEVAEDMINKIKEWIDRYTSDPVLMKGTIVCYVDSADSGGFRTLLQAKALELGVGNIRFFPSTKNRIQTRVDFVNLLMAFGEFEVSDMCKHLAREIGNARQGQDGRCRDDVDDHCINANEYAWIPLLPKIKRYKDFKEH